MLVDAIGEEKNGSVWSSHGWWFLQVAKAETAALSKDLSKVRGLRGRDQSSLNFICIEIFFYFSN